MLDAPDAMRRVCHNSAADAFTQPPKLKLKTWQNQTILSNTAPAIAGWHGLMAGMEPCEECMVVNGASRKVQQQAQQPIERQEGKRIDGHMKALLHIEAGQISKHTKHCTLFDYPAAQAKWKIWQDQNMIISTHQAGHP